MTQRKMEFLTLDFPPIVGGISRYLFEIVSHLPKDEVRVTALAAPDWELFDDQQDFEIDRLGIPSNWDAFKQQLKFFGPFYLRNLLGKKDVSIVLCGQAHYSLLLPAWLISKLRRIPYGVFTYGLDLLYPQTTSYRHLFNHMLEAADVVFADSGAAQQILWDIGIDQGRIHVVYPSVNAANQPVDHTLADLLESRHGMADKKCILTISRLVERKGHDIVLQAMPRILQSVPNAHYLIVGQGANEPTLRALTQELDLESHVTFAGYADDEEVAAYYSLCDVFVMISRAIPEKGDIEGFGIVYLEANIMGKPVVAGNSGGVPEAVVHGETGFLVDPTDPEEVSEAIIRLLQDPELACRFGQQGYQRAVQQFSSEASAAKVNAILKAVVER